MDAFLIIAAGLVGLVFLMILWAASRYKRCPSDRVLVVYGRTAKGQSARCIHGGAAFVWPVIQDYSFLDLTPISIDVDLKNALSKQNIRVDIPSRFTVGISTTPAEMNNAANRLLGQSMDQIRHLAKDIIFGQLRLVIATMNIEAINSDRDTFLKHVSDNVETELKKIGLNLINVNITDIQDESGYINALGKEAAAKAINDARISVAEKDKDGSIGAAIAKQQERIEVAAAEAKATVGEAEANAKSIEGRNLAKIDIAKSDSERREKEAEAESLAVATEKIQAAKALEESYEAERKAEIARAEREMATKKADVIVQAEINKQEAVIKAQAQAETVRELAKGQADAIFLQKEAEAKGLYEILEKQAQGFEQIVKAAGDSKDAVLLLIADKLPELVKLQVEAIKGIKIDKVTVWEGGGQKEGEGNSTSKFVSGLYKSVPPLNDLFNMAGMNLPDYLGTQAENNKPTIIDTDATEVK